MFLLKKSADYLVVAPLHVMNFSSLAMKRFCLDEWIRRMWHIYTMEYYSAIKRNETKLFVVRWMALRLSYRVK